MIRTAEWYLKAYKFLAKFKGYHLSYGSFLDGMFVHYCLHDGKDWFGPEVVIKPNGTMFKRADDNRLLELE